MDRDSRTTALVVPHTHNNLAVALVQMGKRGDALKHYRRALELCPNYAEAHNNLGNALTELGHHEEAIPFLQKVIQLEPELADARFNLGVIFHNLKWHDKAIASFRQRGVI